MIAATARLSVATLLLALFPAGAGKAQEDTPTQTAPVAGEEGELSPIPYEGVPPEYLEARGYLGRLPEAWDTQQLMDKFGAKIFLAVGEGAPRESLDGIDVPDVDLALKDLIAGRMVRQVGGTYRPAFPLIRGETRKTFEKIVDETADRVYPRLRKAFKKVRRAAEKEKVSDYLYALAWSHVLESKRVLESLSDAGRLDSSRLKNEGYLWFLLPNDAYLTAVERYSSGADTLSYVWGAVAFPAVPLLKVDVQREILERALDGRPWDLAEEEEAASSFGFLDSEKRVTIPVLRKDSRVLAELAEASLVYVRALVRYLKPERLAAPLGASRDEAFAPAFASVGYRILQKADREGLIPRPEFLSKPDAPLAGLARTLIVAAEERVDALDHVLYLYDRQEYAGAIREVDRFLEINRDDPESLLRKGLCLMKLKKYPEALATFDRALSHPASPTDVWRGWFLIRSGNVLDLLGRRQEAEERYRKALEFSIVADSRELARGWLEEPYRE